MTGRISIHDIMRYERKLSEIFFDFPQFAEQYEEYESRIRTWSGRTNHTSLLHSNDSHPLFQMIFSTRETIDHYLLEGELELSNPVLDLMTIGWAFENLEEVGLLDRDQQTVSRKVVEYYAEKLWKENNPWDLFFELEVAEMFHTNGLDFQLVHEGETGGPDVLFQWGEAMEVWLECKRKGEPRELVEFKLTTKKFFDSLYDKLEIGDGVYALRISGENLDDTNFADLGSAITALLNRGGSSVEISSRGCDFKIKVLKRSDTPVQVNSPLITRKTGPARATDLERFARGVGLHPESHHSLLADGRFEKENIRDSETRVSDFLALEFDIPVGVDHVNWFMNAVKRARKDLSGHGPSVIFIDVPATELQTMHNKRITDYRGDEVSVHTRVEQKVNGVFNKSESVNGIILTSKLTSPEGLARGITAWWNESPRYLLPANLKNSIETLLSKE